MGGRLVPGSDRARRAVVAIGGVGLAVVIALAVAGSLDRAAIGPAPVSASPGEPVGSPSVSAAPGLFVPDLNPGASAQLAELRSAGSTADARLLQAMLRVPASTWFGGGLPADVEREVRAVMARSGDAVPVLVAYNVPGRDCAQYSAGGAQTGDAYRAWIQGFAAGTADRRVVIILEPDGLALQPTDCGQPDTFGRAALIGDALDTIRAANPAAAIYLDAGHSAWHTAADMARRLVRAGVRRATGFFLNASNYRATADLVAYGTQISACIGSADPAGECGGGTGGASGPPLAGGTPFVIDTSRNGQGPWTPTATYPDAQDWCNPPGRGVGLRPTLATGVPLVDAYLWIKIPGESDGTCTRGGSAGSPDPEWDRIDPVAGQWFPEQALELARLANPPLTP